LFDAFSHLSNSISTWNHTLVGWTGEIKPQRTLNKPKKEPSIDSALPPLNKASAPVPLDTSSRRKEPVYLDGVQLTPSDRAELETQLLEDSTGKIVPVWLFDESEEGRENITCTNQARWRRYAEHELYTLFHYKQQEFTDGRAERKAWGDYCRVNQKFADKILEIYKPGDIVWIHDYHLMLLPSLLRQRKPDIYIGFYLHVPFPSSELFKCLSRRKELLTGILGSNMIGFQNYSYSRHFASCCSRILGYETQPAGIDAFGAHIAMDVFPIGIDASSIERQAYGHKINNLVKRIRELYPGCKLIVGRDRLDTVRGVAQKLQAYEMFLEKYPQWENKVVLIQVTSPTSIEEEKEDSGNKIASKVSDLVSRINGRFGGLEHNPVYHYPQYLSRDEYFALLRVADIGLITSVRDGMNTTSLEYIICQKDNHGPLILSEFSGTASSLHDAITINPWDLGGVADSINRALTMSSEEKATQHRKLYQHVFSTNVQEWIKTYLGRLLVNLASFNQSIATPALDKTDLLTHYTKAKRRLFMFDYDGTLTPIVKDPQAAIPSDRIIRTIKTLARDKRNNVWIISGRDQAFLDEWMGHISELGLSAEHGSFIRLPDHDEWENLTATMDMSWQREVIEVFSHYTERTQGSFIERKKIAVTWHFRRSDPEYGAFQAKECKKHLEDTLGKRYDIEVMNGKANLEVRPRFVNKGEIAKRLVKEYGEGPDNEPDFVFCTGDDFTDEDMFRALRGTDLPKDQVFTVTVGASSKQTLAYWHLLEPSDVIATIALLNGSVSIGDIGAASAANQRLHF
jgi:trehalose 6-phosphate synthase/phosphatase